MRPKASKNQTREKKRMQILQKWKMRVHTENLLGQHRDGGTEASAHSHKPEVSCVDANHAWSASGQKGTIE